MLISDLGGDPSRSEDGAEKQIDRHRVQAYEQLQSC
jgi:hypothetical protein